MSETINKQTLKQFLTREIAMTNFYKNTEMQAVTIALKTVLKEIESGKFDIVVIENTEEMQKEINFLRQERESLEGQLQHYRGYQ